LLGKKNVNGQPHIDSIEPAAGLPGGEVRILGSGLNPQGLRRPRVRFGDIDGAVVVSTHKFVIARVPDGAQSGPLSLTINEETSNTQEFRVGSTIAENLHPVTNPALDAEGNLYVTFSGSRGQKVPVAIFKIDTNYNVKPYLADMMNATSIAFDREGQMYVSSRFDGTVYRVARNGTMATYAEGMGIATGIAFDAEQNLYVGDRSGTIFKINRDRDIFVFATLEPSVSAYHLAFHPNGDLYVTGPTTSSVDGIHRITPAGDVSLFFKGLGRPQGLAFDADGNAYVAASLNGRRGIVRINPDAKASMAIAGQGLVGLCFTPGRSVILASTSAVHRLSWDIQGIVLQSPEL
jgi:DNA-binding beta-propeller fold protein YncE